MTILRTLLRRSGCIFNILILISTYTNHVFKRDHPDLEQASDEVGSSCCIFIVEKSPAPGALNALKNFRCVDLNIHFHKSGNLDMESHVWEAMMRLDAPLRFGI